MSDDQTLLQTEGELPGPAASIVEERPELPGYTLVTRLGIGSFGEVWAGIQDGTGQRVAIKLLHHHIIDVAIFAREVERLRELSQHPNVVTLLDARLGEPPRFLAMPQLETSLAQHAGAFPAQVAEWLEQAATALEFCHRKGILHCDLKPANMLLDAEGRLNLCDFGQAISTDEQSLTLGSLGFMAPEHIEWALKREGSPDTSWDIYGLGATAYMLLCGRLPRLNIQRLTGATGTAGRQRLEACAAMMAEEPLVPIRRLNRKVDRDLAAIVERCLRLSPSKRTPGARALLDDLRRRSTSRPVQSRPWNPFYILKRWTRRNRLVAAALLCLGGGMFGLASWLTNPDMPQLDLTPPDPKYPLAGKEWGILEQNFTDRCRPLPDDLSFSLKDFNRFPEIPQAVVPAIRAADLSGLSKMRANSDRDFPRWQLPPDWKRPPGGVQDTQGPADLFQLGEWNLCLRCHAGDQERALQLYLDLLFMARAYFGLDSREQEAELLGLWRMVGTSLLTTPDGALQEFAAGLETLRQFNYPPNVHYIERDREVPGWGLDWPSKRFEFDSMMRRVRLENVWFSRLNAGDYKGLRNSSVDFSRREVTFFGAMMHPVKMMDVMLMRKRAVAFYREAVSAAYWEMRFDALRIEVAAERFRRKMKRPMASLEELCPAFLDSVPNNRVLGGKLRLKDRLLVVPLPERERSTVDVGDEIKALGPDPYDDLGTVYLDIDRSEAILYIEPPARAAIPLHQR